MKLNRIFFKKVEIHKKITLQKVKFKILIKKVLIKVF
jgi:hypothetical protein